MTEDAEKNREIVKPLEQQAPPEAAQRSGVIGENVNQARWRQTQQAHILEQGESATDLFYDPNFKPKDKSAKFELFDDTASAEQVKQGKFIDYPPAQLDKKTFALGMDYENQPRSYIEKMGDIVQSAARRATDPEGQQKYIQNELDKIIGIGRGLNIAKEETKELAQVGWKALTDGSVAKFLAQPNAINDPLFKVVGGTLETMASDPNATNKALERLGAGIVDASERFSKLPGGKQGEFLGEVLFYSFNPSGSTEGVELALKIADSVATKVDATAMKALEQSISIAKDLRSAAPGLAEQAQDIAIDYARKLGLTPQEAEYAGVPREWFKPQSKVPLNDNYMAMSSDGQGSAFRGDHDVYSKVNERGRPKSYVNTDGDLTPVNADGMYKDRPVRLAEHLNGGWCKGQKANSPFTSFGYDKGHLVAKYGKDCIELDLAALEAEMAAGKAPVKGIHKLDAILRSIEEEATFPKWRKTYLSNCAKRDNEVMIEGVLPKRFFKVLRP